MNLLQQTLVWKNFVFAHFYYAQYVVFFWLELQNFYNFSEEIVKHSKARWTEELFQFLFDFVIGRDVCI